MSCVCITSRTRCLYWVHINMRNEHRSLSVSSNTPSMAQPATLQEHAHLHSIFLLIRFQLFCARQFRARLGGLHALPQSSLTLPQCLPGREPALTCVTTPAQTNSNPPPLQILKMKVLHNISFTFKSPISQFLNLSLGRDAFR